MGIFTNFEVDPKVYKSNLNDNTAASNQDAFRINYVQHFLEQQNEINDSLTHSVTDLHHAVRQSNLDHIGQFEYLSNKIDEQDKLAVGLHSLLQKQEQINEKIIERLTVLEQKSDNLVTKMEADGLINQAILEQQAFQDASLSKLAGKIDDFEGHSSNLANQLHQQSSFFAEFSNKIEMQEVFHQTVMERLDQQEGLIKKISRELDNIRSIIFERASHLIESFEINFSKLSKPVQRFFVNQEENEKEKIENT